MDIDHDWIGRRVESQGKTDMQLTQFTGRSMPIDYICLLSRTLQRMQTKANRRGKAGPWVKAASQREVKGQLKPGGGRWRKSKRKPTSLGTKVRKYRKQSPLAFGCQRRTQRLKSIERNTHVRPNGADMLPKGSKIAYFTLCCLMFFYANVIFSSQSVSGLPRRRQSGFAFAVLLMF